MDKSKSYAIQYAIIIALIVAIVCLMWVILARANSNVDITYAPDNTIYDNPLIGFAPDGANRRLCEKTKLVYITLTWKEWEPKEGEFDIASLEEKYNIGIWKAEKKHAVIRFMCDLPGDIDHMDIPTWLYNKTDKGTYYNTSIGRGFSPDYSDSVFMNYHKKAIEALAEYCNKDSFVSFVQLGSLGHWGEWHAADNQGNSIMPDAEICREYVNVYSNAFVNARLMTRRNYDFSVDNNIGVYNDMVGHSEETQEWLNWINNGGTQRTNGNDLILKASPDIGLTCPIGGEFTSNISMDRILGDGLGDTLQSITESRMTFLGPKVPDFTKEKYKTQSDSILRRMGYRIYPSRLKIVYDFAHNTTDMDLSFRNSGNAAFYFQWPVTVAVFDKDYERVFWQGTDIDLRKLSADEDVTTSISVPSIDKIKEEYYIGVLITDYDGEDIVKLAVDLGSDPEVKYIDNYQIIYHYKK